MARNVIAAYPDTGSFPEAPFVVKFLEPTIACNDIVHFSYPADAPTLFYMWYYGVAERCAEPSSPATREFFIVKKSSYAIGDLTDKPVTKTMDFGDAAVYEALYPGRQ
jgi:hypothetical protein